MSPQEPQEPPFLGTLEWPGDVRDLAAAGATWPWLTAAGCAVAALAFWWRRRTRRAVVVMASAPAAGPADAALAALRALVVPTEAGAAAAFCAQVKALVRQHCRERFGLRAEVATSEELVGRLPAAPLRQCLAITDGVLFAAAPASLAELQQCHAHALVFAATAEAA